jgi:SAM-dependent methyltransferase
MKPSFKVSLQHYYDQVAPRYVDIEPAFGPLVDELIALAAPKAHERVLDAGTGTGLAARRCVDLSRMVCGLDFSRQMLETARGYGSGNLLRSDIHQLPLGSSAFDVVLASFALNSADPARSLSEVCRVLVPGGRLVFQEWSVLDPLSELVLDTVAGYAVDDPPPALAAMRALMEAPVPWDDLDGPDDIETLVKDVGFADIEMKLERALVRLPDVETFIRYKVAWPNRWAEIDAMPGETRRLCLSDLRENLAARAEPDGSLAWQPEVIRIWACKPAN